MAALNAAIGASFAVGGELTTNSVALTGNIEQMFRFSSQAARREVLFLTQAIESLQKTK